MQEYLQNLENEIKNCENQIHESEKKITKSKDLIESKKQELAEYSSRLDSVQSEFNAIKQEYEQKRKLRQELLFKNENCGNISNEIKQLQEEMELKEDTITPIQSKIQGLRDEIKSLENKTQTASEEIQDLNNKIKSYSSCIDLNNAGKAFGEALCKYYEIKRNNKNAAKIKVHSDYLSFFDNLKYIPRFFVDGFVPKFNQNTVSEVESKTHDPFANKGTGEYKTVVSKQYHTSTVNNENYFSYYAVTK